MEHSITRTPKLLALLIILGIIVGIHASPTSAAILDHKQ